MQNPDSLTQAGTVASGRGIAPLLFPAVATFMMLVACSAADSSLAVPSEPSMARASGGATLSALVVSPASVVGGTQAQGTVTITSPAPAKGTTISLASSDAAASVPATVIVARGQTTATFAITTTAGAVATAAITAVHGKTTRSAQLGIVAADLASVTFPPATVQVGAIARGVVSLNGPAASNTFVGIASSDPSSADIVGGGATIIAGAASATFDVIGVSAAPSVTVTATLGATTRTTQIAVVLP